MRILQMLYFYPRGGSAQVVRYLSAALGRAGAEVQIVSGSLGKLGDRTCARTFFADQPLDAIDYSPALNVWHAGDDPLRAEIPFHPSYEDRTDVPDRIFTSVSPDIAEHLEDAWTSLLADQLDTPPDVAHIHHLTPLQVAVRRCFPNVPIVGHLHGTELKMLWWARRRLALADQLGVDLQHGAEHMHTIDPAQYELDAEDAELLQSTRWEMWRYAKFWLARMHTYASLCDRIIALNEDDRELATDLLGVDSALIDVIPNGVDLTRFHPNPPAPDERRRRWQEWLVEAPQGWGTSSEPGTVRYQADEVDEWFFAPDGSPRPVLFYVGRFVNMKRVPLLIRAYAQARDRFNDRAPLVIWGGYPGEWENEHPVDVAREVGPDGVFFIGWRGHDELPDGLNAADVMVAPSVNEPFGQVYLEAMACGLPVIGTRSGGPLSFVDTGSETPNGWLVAPDSLDELADILVTVVNSAEERLQRGRHAEEMVRERYSWDGIARRFCDTYQRAIEAKRAT